MSNLGLISVFSTNSYGYLTLDEGIQVVYTILTILIGIIALGGGLFAYFFFLAPKQGVENKGAKAFICDLLNFKKMAIDYILKLIYIVTAIGMTLFALRDIFFLDNKIDAIINFLQVLVIGNLFLRIGYELIAYFVLFVKNTIEINKKLGGNEAGFIDIKNPIANKPAQPQYYGQAPGYNNYQQAPGQPPMYNNYQQAPTQPVPQYPAPAPVQAAPVYEAPAQVYEAPAPVPAPVYEAPVAPVYEAPAPAASSSKFCAVCGKPIEADAKFCPFCGGKN